MDQKNELRLMFYVPLVLAWLVILFVGSEAIVRIAAGLVLLPVSFLIIQTIENYL